MTDPGNGRRLAVAPERGAACPAASSAGSRLPAGRPLGVVRGGRGDVHVSAAHAGVLAGWPAREGDLVDAGDPIARLYPEVPS